MALTLVVNGNTVAAADLNQIINVLMRPAGQSEVGNYYLQGSSYATGARVALYMRSTSQGSTPASLVIDTTIQAASNIPSPSQDQVTQYGFHLFASSTGIATDCKAAGVYTLAY